MIRFACAHCGMKFQVNDKLANRAGKCPGCKQAVLVPPLNRPLKTLPTGHVEGTPSSLQRTGLDVSVTIETPKTPSEAGRASVANLLAGRLPQGSRYLIEKEIARGGMGAVMRAVDCDIRREVAIKYMLDDSDQSRKSRFVEEAQITGQLEHPNIVPIHELGLDAEQRLFFAMKMVNGRSLGQILDELREQPATAESVWSLGRLLNIFVNVCHAMAYAHSRGVIHRDLKPANIMVGDFGEVYVMDWGLAKVLGQEPSATNPETTDGDTADLAHEQVDTVLPEVSERSGSGSSTRVVTIRELDGDFTQDGSIMGTPAYMSPEQARGEVQLLDQKSDLYSLGAILYELLTLHSPIDKVGGHMAVLLRVTAGEIKPPEKRTPQRVRQGKIPKELSAVAMKALAMQPEQRYPDCESLRRDIERFQEGRSVSAKDDTPWEAAVKFVKRNKGFSAATGTGLLVLAVVLAVAFSINYAARVRAEQNYDDYLHEQQAKNEAIRKSIPGTLRAARQLANDGAVPDALSQIALVRSYEPDNAEARLLLAQIQMAERKWPEAAQELAAYLEQHPDDRDAAALHKLAMSSEKDELVAMFAVADILTRHRLFNLTTRLLNDAPKLLEARKPLQELYDKQVKTVWPTRRVELTKDGQLQFGPYLGLRDKELTDLRPIAGMKLDILELSGCEKLSDLEPLRGMPLTRLHLNGNLALKNLEPLRGMPLRHLEVYGCPQLSDLEPLRGMPLEELNISGNPVSDIGPLEGMSLRKLDALSCPLADLGPLRNMPLESFRAASYSIRDLEPLRGAPCAFLDLSGCTEISSLEPLQGMPCTTLKLSTCRSLENIEPLRGMPCTTLDINRCGKINDLEPLRGMPLTYLRIQGTAVRDVSSLGDIPLTELHFDVNNIDQGFDVLRGMKSLLKINTLSAPEFWRRYDAGEFKK